MESRGIFFGLLLCGAIAIDYFFFDSAGLIFAGKQMLRTVEYFAFWR